MSNILEKARTLFEDARNIELIEQNVACVTIPHLDQHNDYLQIYLIAEEKRCILTDDGWILADIKHSKYYDKNQALIDKILKRFNKERSEDEIYMKTDIANLTKAKDNFIQAILAVVNTGRKMIQIFNMHRLKIDTVS